MYVGITRAQLCLTITHAKSRAKYGRRVEGQPLALRLYELNEARPRRRIGGPPGQKAQSACSR